MTAAPNTQGQASQQVLKAEAATPDATDRVVPAISSPDGGPMGAGQPAAAGPVTGPLALTEIHALLMGVRLAIGEVRADMLTRYNGGATALGEHDSKESWIYYRLQQAQDSLFNADEELRRALSDDPRARA